MKRWLCAWAFLTVCLNGFGAERTVEVRSPDGKNRFVLLYSSEEIRYEVWCDGFRVVSPSRLGFVFDSGAWGDGLELGRIERKRIDETYRLVVGKVREARSFCNAARIPLSESGASARRIDLEVRAFNDGVAFRFLFPQQETWQRYVMYEERTQFNLSGDPEALVMYLPGYVNTHEGPYVQVGLDQVDSARLIELPATFRYPGRLYVSILEAGVRDYAGMYLMRGAEGFEARLSPKLGQERIKVVADSLPHRTPWRVLSMGASMKVLLRSTILTDLNDPCAIADTSWIKPCRTTFTWWNGNVVPDTLFSPGNNFETNKYYIDFAARHGIDLHGIYGYAETPWYYDDNFNFGNAGPHADPTRPIPCLEMPRIVAYAREKGVGLHLWVHWRALYPKLEEAFALYEKWGVRGLMIDFMDRDDQEMIRIQEEFLQAAARHKLFVQFHGSSKPSGLVRTYPNEFTREGTMNYEVCKWSDAVTADHDVSIPFTRMLAGATDYHLGGFRSERWSEFRPRYINPRVPVTRCHMLAMYVVLENHLTMLCDTPAAYEGAPGFEFILEVPATWDEIRVPHAVFNRYVTVARRKEGNWWVGSLNNGERRDLTLSLDFLDEGVDYLADIYLDGSDADPGSLQRIRRIVRRSDRIELPLAPDGGAALHLKPMNNH
ncbi:glycoside hydrolase family 97 protein [uncultured Alistipes sp.]|uniref:glycoside hydrolase family 97 protein n=1 Tax=uncultured Alistipes sp. TaxID=538949 RepID=UPI00266665EB|nr:glycoside hydrolase family 97 protein [uncultured Alistipes sp.]